MRVGLESFIKFGYFIVVATMLLMIWASLSNAKELYSLHEHPPCMFNPQCTCSSSFPSFGDIKCRDIPMYKIPKTINNSTVQVYTLTIQNTGLIGLERFTLRGLYRLEISRSKINTLPNDTFDGLEKSLWELYLFNNHLTEMPSRALRNLQKLRILDLSGNEISGFDQSTWKGYGENLRHLNLADNSISAVDKDGFRGLPYLESLDLSSNSISQLSPEIFQDGLGRISKLSLADNLLTAIPYMALSPLKLLRTLDLSQNRIRRVTPDVANLSLKLSLDSLHLDYNFIDQIETNSFNNFDIVNKTYFDGNSIDEIESRAFQYAKIREIYLRSCNLQTISPDSFDGLEGSLQILDLSNNNLTQISPKLTMNFTLLNTLIINDNLISFENKTPESLNGIATTLHDLNIKAPSIGISSIKDLKLFKNLRTLAITGLTSKTLSTEDFSNFESSIENLKITQSQVTKLNSHALQHLRGLKILDLSENNIETIDQSAFVEVGHSIQKLIMSNGLSSQMKSLPIEPLKPLVSLQHLDVSNNKLKTIAENALHFLRNLEKLELHDNEIDTIVKGTFQGEIHENLEEISYSYNKVRTISKNTFADLNALRHLFLDDNQIEQIENQSFLNLAELDLLNLRGNKISDIKFEAFQHLPRLELLDLSYNVLTQFDFGWMDQVGSLSSLHLNLSHNKITTLSSSKNKTISDSLKYANIKLLDLSHNNISRIEPNFFEPCENSLIHLYLGYNELKNTSQEVFGNLQHLQLLDLSHNLISEINNDMLQNSRKLQVLRVCHNKLNNISSGVLAKSKKLRIVNLSYNLFRTLPDHLFVSEEMESLDVSYNQLSKVPASSFSNLAALSVTFLNFSHNNIGSIHSMDFSNFQWLSILDLSNNRIIRLEDAVFATLLHLSVLDLSHNIEIEILEKTFVGLENNLIELNLSNLSLNSFPELCLSHLKTLKVSHNELSFLPYEIAANISSLQNLDLSYNELAEMPRVIHSLPNLRSLSVAGNPIRSITNDSLTGASRTLQHLDIAELQLTNFESGALDNMLVLMTLKLSSYSHIKAFNIPQLIQNVQNLRSLWICNPVTIIQNDNDTSQQIVVANNIKTDLRLEMEGKLPEKLKKIRISGLEFQSIAGNILQGLQSPVLHLALINTSITNIPSDIFKNAVNLRNISLDLRNGNNLLRKIPNPNLFEDVPMNQVLTDLRVSGNSLQCDCELGWIEFWMRKKRQYICPIASHAANKQEHLSEDCKYTNDLREAMCKNKNNEKLLEILKKDIECGWGSNAIRHSTSLILFVVPIFLLFWV